jgi:predicted MFS family arabinose efflux permease
MTIVAENSVNKKHISPSMTLVMAVTCGMAVANIYYNQPMLGIIEQTFPGHEALTSLVATATQFGYALGLLLLVPLGDRLDRRTLILIQTVALGLSLAGMASAQDAWTLLFASTCVGITASVAQQILPFAAELSSPTRRGTTIGIVMSGLLCGILFSRVLAGSIGEHYGWRAMFWLGLMLAAFMGILLSLTLPRCPPKTDASYLKLLKSLVVIWKEEPLLRRATYIQSFVFASFSALWTTLAFHLDANYHLSAEIAGLFGVVGAAGVLFAPVAGKIADNRGPHFVIGMATSLMVLSWIIMGLWGTLIGMVAGVILLDFGAQSAQVSNQHVIQGLRSEIRSRLNALLMGGMFTGGALGSAGSTLAWRYDAWPAVSFFAAVLALSAYIVHARAQREEKKAL